MTRRLPELSRFELQCMRGFLKRGEASARDIHQSLPNPPSYSTIRKIIERLEQKGAVERVRLEGRAWIYRSSVPVGSILRKEIRRLVDSLFEGRGVDLLAHLVDMNEVSLDDLREMEATAKKGAEKTARKEVSSRARRQGAKRR